MMTVRSNRDPLFNATAQALELNYGFDFGWKPSTAYFMGACTLLAGLGCVGTFVFLVIEF